MMNYRLCILALALYSPAAAQQPRLEWVSTTPDTPWRLQPSLPALERGESADLVVDTAERFQVIRGFGACFNELGWVALGRLPQEAREAVLREFFAPGVGANLTLCRMPVGANDFSTDWYSYDETPGDLSLAHFSIARDRETLVPFIHAAQRYNPDLRLWASPWSPPTWMKTNGHYACAGEGAEGTNQFDPAYFKTYAAYFARFIEAYRAEGISISMVMPQNEFNSCQVFPSCTWTAAALATFVGRYLGPDMHRLGVHVYFGTMERPNPALVDTILQDHACARYVSGVGFQWAGKGAIADIHRRYPGLTLYQSEQECGNGKNDWAYATYTWTLMRHYLTNGAGAYMYWNLALPQGGVSHWGWTQNSLVTVDTLAGTATYTPDYYVFKHLTHFVHPGARRLACRGAFEDALAFRNRDGSIVVVAANPASDPRLLRIRIGARVFSAFLPPGSFHTFILKQPT